MSFFTLIKIELKKIRRSGIFILLLLPVIIIWLPAIWNGDSHFHMEDVGISPENSFLIQGFMGMAWFMIPATFVICTVLLIQTERNNKGMLKMLSLPVSTSKLCMAKLTVILLLGCTQMVMTLCMYFLSAAAASRIFNYPFLLEVPYVCKVTGELYLSAVPMAAVFWMIAVLIQTPFFSIGIGLASLVPSVLLINTKIWYAYPMCYPFYILMTEYGKAAADIFTAKAELIPWIPAAAVITVSGIFISCARFGYAERK